MVRLRVPVTSLLLMILLSATARADAPTSDSQGTDPPANALLGSWHLVWLKAPGPDGAVRPVDCSGKLVFTREGTMAVQVMYADESADNEGGTVRYTLGGYEASYGRYAYTRGTHSFTYHVDGSLVRALIGKDLPRSYELTGSRLIIRSTDPVEHWEVGWEHDQEIRP